MVVTIICILSLVTNIIKYKSIRYLPRATAYSSSCKCVGKVWASSSGYSGDDVLVPVEYA